MDVQELMTTTASAPTPTSAPAVTPEPGTGTELITVESSPTTTDESTALNGVYKHNIVDSQGEVLIIVSVSGYEDGSYPVSPLLPDATTWDLDDDIDRQSEADSSAGSTVSWGGGGSGSSSSSNSGNNSDNSANNNQPVNTPGIPPGVEVIDATPPAPTATIPVPTIDAATTEPPKEKWLIFEWRVSLRHLILASKVFKTLLEAEIGTPEYRVVDGQRLRILRLDGRDRDPETIGILVDILHGRNSSLPSDISVDELGRLAKEADYWECCDIVRPYADRWVGNLWNTISETCDSQLIIWLFIAEAFTMGSVLTHLTKIAILNSTRLIAKPELPVLSREDNTLFDDIQRVRCDALSKLFRTVYTLIDNLQGGQTTCSQACESRLLGDLMKDLSPYLSLRQIPQSPYTGLSISMLVGTLLCYESWNETNSDHQCNLRIPQAIMTTKQSLINEMPSKFHSPRLYRMLRSVKRQVEAIHGLERSVDARYTTTTTILPPKPRESAIQAPSRQIHSRKPIFTPGPPTVIIIDAPELPTSPTRDLDVWDSPVDKILAKLLSKDVQKDVNNLSISEPEIRLLCQNARGIIKSQDVLLRLAAPIHIVGCIRGDFKQLNTIFNHVGSASTANYLFLGDYAKPGKANIATLSLLLALKIKYPNNIFLLRGFGESLSGHGSVLAKDCAKYHLDTWKILMQCLESLPLAAIIGDSIICTFRGLPQTLESPEDLNKLERPIGNVNEGAINEILCAASFRNSRPTNYPLGIPIPSILPPGMTINPPPGTGPVQGPPPPHLVGPPGNRNGLERPPRPGLSDACILRYLDKAKLSCFICSSPHMSFPGYITQLQQRHVTLSSQLSKIYPNRKAAIIRLDKRLRVSFIQLCYARNLEDDTSSGSSVEIVG